MYTLQLMKIRSDRQQHIINPKHIKENILSSAAQINISKASHSYIYITCYRAKKIKALCHNSENKNLLFFEKQIKIYKNIYLEKDVFSCIYTTKYSPSLIKKNYFNTHQFNTVAAASNSPTSSTHRYCPIPLYVPVVHMYNNLCQQNIQ